MSVNKSETICMCNLNFPDRSADLAPAGSSNDPLNSPCDSADSAAANFSNGKFYL